MSRAIQGSSAAPVLSTVSDIHRHLSAKVRKATRGLIGVEQELFLVTPQGTPLPFAQVENIIRRMHARLPGSSLLNEGPHVVGLTHPELGDVCLEPGGQIELSCAPCETLDDLASRQSKLYATLKYAARREGARIKGAGHLPAFIGAPTVPRSRFAAYIAYCIAAHGEDKAHALVDTMKSCTGLQVNVDPMGKDFRKVYLALMAVELADSFKRRSPRHRRFAETYAPLFPRQVTPLFNAVAAKNNSHLLSLIIDRLLTLNVPFVPDVTSPEGFVSSSDVYGHTPTVGELMHQGHLTTTLLDNALSLQMTMPNLRRHGVLETRSPDTPAKLSDALRIADSYHRAAYHPATRNALVSLIAACDPALLGKAFDARFKLPTRDFMRLPLGDTITVASFVQTVHSLVQNKTVVAPRAGQRPK